MNNLGFLGTMAGVGTYDDNVYGQKIYCRKYLPSEPSDTMRNTLKKIQFLKGDQGILEMGLKYSYVPIDILYGSRPLHKKEEVFLKSLKNLMIVRQNITVLPTLLVHLVIN